MLTTESELTTEIAKQSVAGNRRKFFKHSKRLQSRTIISGLFQK